MKFLPLVSPDVGYSVANSLGDGCDLDNLDSWKKELRKIKVRNPVIAEWIKEWSRLAKHNKQRLHALICGVCVYKLLESQAEADQMNEQFG